MEKGEKEAVHCKGNLVLVAIMNVLGVFKIFFLNFCSHAQLEFSDSFSGVSLEYTAVPKHPGSQHSLGDFYIISSNILLFSLGTHS